jgi:DNA-binding GntR family transcriptional regulator
MQQKLTPRTLQRAQWFRDLTDPLVDAEKLLEMFEADGGLSTETAQLRIRIQNVQSELAQLNRVAAGEGRVLSKCWPQPMQAGTADA